MKKYKLKSFREIFENLPELTTSGKIIIGGILGLIIFAIRTLIS